MVYAKRDGLWVCGFNGGGFLRLSDDKTLAVKYRNTDKTIEYAKTHGLVLIPA